MKPSWGKPASIESAAQFASPVCDVPPKSTIAGSFLLVSESESHELLQTCGGRTNLEGWMEQVSQEFRTDVNRPSKTFLSMRLETQRESYADGSPDRGCQKPAGSRADERIFPVAKMVNSV